MRCYDKKSANLFPAKTGNYWKFSVPYTKVRKIFSKKENYNKFKKLMKSWVTKGIAKSSQKKQRFYEKYLKKHIADNEKIYNILLEFI